jgi:phage shock protein PspC (stress-responsive transcriptional regulator)
MDTKRFARSGNAFLFGVCAGLAEYVGVPAILVRVLWVILALTSWLGWLAFIAYIVLMFVMPPPEGTPAGERFNFKKGMNGRNFVLVCAAALIYWGACIIISEFLDFDVGRYLLPAGLILGGALLLVFALKGGRRS